jgi:hypothetical protein
MVECAPVHSVLSPGSTIAIMALIAVVGCAPERDEETGELAEAGDIGVFQLEVGDCLADFQDGTELSSVDALPCSEPHSDEIYASGRIPDGDDFPGPQALEAAARELCLSEYADFVGLPYDDSVLDIGYLKPTEESWADGDREVLCTIFDPAAAEEVTGSLRGAKR